MALRVIECTMMVVAMLLLAQEGNINASSYLVGIFLYMIWYDDVQLWYLGTNMHAGYLIKIWKDYSNWF